MTRIVILADIHGNLPALEAVMIDIQQAAPDQVIVNGDIINRGPQSKECVQAVRAAGWPGVFGNHEEYILKYVDKTGVPDEWYSDFWLPFPRVADELSADEIAYLRALPHERVIAVPGLPALRVVHGSMRRLNEGLGHWLSDDELRTAIHGAEEPVIVGAHTHRTYEHRIDGRWVLNCGSVGVPYNGNPAAQYLVLTGANGAWQAEFRAVPYDRALVYDAWEQTGYMQRTMSAQVFKYEVETATYHLGGYLHFCEQHGLERNAPVTFARYKQATAGMAPGCSMASNSEW